jgi:hypothetical protein
MHALGTKVVMLQACRLACRQACIAYSTANFQLPTSTDMLRDTSCTIGGQRSLPAILYTLASHGSQWLVFLAFARMLQDDAANGRQRTRRLHVGSWYGSQRPQRTGEVDEAVLPDHDLLDQLAAPQLDARGVVEGGHNLPARHLGQPLDAVEVGVLDRHDAYSGQAGGREGQHAPCSGRCRMVARAPAAQQLGAAWLHPATMGVWGWHAGSHASFTAGSTFALSLSAGAGGLVHCRHTTAGVQFPTCRGALGGFPAATMLLVIGRHRQAKWAFITLVNCTACCKPYPHTCTPPTHYNTVGPYNTPQSTMYQDGTTTPALQGSGCRSWGVPASAKSSSGRL